MKKSTKDLFLELANPDENGRSRWVEKKEFVGKYSSLMFTNGFSWGRKGSSLDKEYIVEVRRDLTPGNTIDAIRTNGFNKEFSFSQAIRSDIINFFKNKKCVMLGINGDSINTKIEIDHKEGTKDNPRVSNRATQKIEDFQPLCKAANDAKRQICKKCQETNIRYDARNLEGFPLSYYKGGAELSIYGCEGCYQYDPVKYRMIILELARKGEI